jgi:hypothetical protein
MGGLPQNKQRLLSMATKIKSVLERENPPLDLKTEPTSVSLVDIVNNLST